MQKQCSNGYTQAEVADSLGVGITTLKVDSVSEVSMTDTIDTTEYMLTTVDNPFDPFTRFEEWYAYDVRMGYNTASFLERIAKNSR